MVAAASVCIDRYEASVWDAPTGGTQLVTEAQIDAACPDNGQNCPGIYARSVAGVEPARGINWFQAQHALANARQAPGRTGRPARLSRGAPLATPSFPC